jgi:hypothetical protein
LQLEILLKEFLIENKWSAFINFSKAKIYKREEAPELLKKEKENKAQEVKSKIQKFIFSK